MVDTQGMAWLGRTVAVGVLIGAGLLVAPLVTPTTLEPEPIAAVVEPPVTLGATAATPPPAVAPTPTTAPPTTTTVPPSTTTTAVPEVVGASAAAATETPEPAPAPPSTPAEIGAVALARIDYPWERLGWSVTFAGENPGLLGEARCASNEIFVYVRPGQTIQQVAFVTAFELGHAIDCGTMNDTRRAEWAAIRGFAPGWTWFPGCRCTEDNFGSGDISMVFATWLVPEGGYRWRSNLAPPPSAEQLSRLMPYLRPAGI